MLYSAADRLLLSHPGFCFWQLVQALLCPASTWAAGQLPLILSPHDVRDFLWGWRGRNDDHLLEAWEPAIGSKRTAQSGLNSSMGSKRVCYTWYVQSDAGVARDSSITALLQAPRPQSAQMRMVWVSCGTSGYIHTSGKAFQCCKAAAVCGLTHLARPGSGHLR